jgi:hypothetical protein
MIYKDFRRLFTKREIQEINGRKSKNLIILTSILFGTFMAIAISIGGIEYLSLKMNDPFVQNLEIDVPYSKSKEIESIKLDLNHDTLKTAFKYDTVLAITIYSRSFWDVDRKGLRPAKGQSIEPGSPILKQVLNKKNLLYGRTFEDDRDCGLIVTEKFLNDFGYSSKEFFVSMQVLKQDTGYFLVPVPIIAVVKELPGVSLFAFTPFFFKMVTSGQENPFYIEDYGRISIFAPVEDKKKALEIEKGLEKFLESDPESKDLDPIVNSSKNTDSYQPGYAFDISFSSQLDINELNKIYSKILNSSELSGFSKEFNRYYFYKFPMFPQAIIGYDKLCVSFNDLKKVNDFKEFLFKKTELVVEMSKIRDKENFIAISILTVTMASLLLIFSVISVGLFIFNLLKTHLDKIKTNLGTFKAFGLSNKDLQSIYKGIVRRFYLRALVIGYISATIFDILLVVSFFQELRPFHLVNIYSLGAIIVIWAIVEWVFGQTSKTILVNTPGDLIYGRDHN